MMEQKSGLNPDSPKTNVNRLLLFILISFTTLVPLSFMGLNFESITFNPRTLALPSVLAVLIFMFARESRTSEVKPKMLEFFFSGLGAFYPSVLVAIILWFVWWASYGLAVLFGVEGGLYGAADRFATAIFSWLSFISAIFLARMNWRHLVNQLYPQMGNHSAFAQISATGKLWLLKRAVLFSILFFVLLIVYFAIVPGSEDAGIGLELYIGFAIVIIYLFFISISAWLWVRKPEVPRGIELTNRAITQLLQPFGYEVKTLAEIKNDPDQEVTLSDQMTASVDLVASRKDSSLVIDVMTVEETAYSPDWVIASEFRSAVWYLKNALQLPSPVEAVAVLVDIIPDDSLISFANEQNVKVIQLSGEEVVDIFAPDRGDQSVRNKYASLFSPSLADSVNGLPPTGNGGPT